MRQLFKRSVIVLGITASAGACIGADNKLTATVADISGKCMLEASWVDVSGRYIYWEVSGPRIRPHWHKSDLVHPTEKAQANASDDSPVLRSPFAFALNLSGARLKGPAFDFASPELAYRDAMRIKLKMPNLVAAVMVHHVSEYDLWGHNLTNGTNVFNRDNSDTRYYVPVRYSVCDVEVRYLMNMAEAVFEKPLIGKIVIRSNQTVPLKQGKRSFAEEILNRRD
jgi:hypothetical protein